ncbi:hypothetical protein [Vibrio astriarenae]|uniref:hypothetical protein n=1 Tax=Vibrio astriarenae TaxID=1481923 RepID=UPI0037358035
MRVVTWILVGSALGISAQASASYSAVSPLEQATGYCTVANGSVGKVVDAKQYGMVCSEYGMGLNHGYQQCMTSTGELGQKVDAKEYGHQCLSYRSDITQSRYACTNEMGEPGLLVDAKEYGIICSG